ncbi:MAG: hypothetical protein KAT58_10990, partial [candidate division Zixibacteria bacterium]|nr:hypothetical protein [candidate division Zixibacteria bacterium]
MRYDSVGKAGLTLVLGVVVSLLMVGSLAIETAAALIPDYASEVHGLNKPTIGPPCSELRVHRVGNILLSVTNYGIFGNQAEPIEDPETGLPAPSCQYPAGSGVEYLFQGALWIGAIVGQDTLCSTGHDGWQHVFEMWPDACDNGGGMIKRSTRKTDFAYDPDAISEADYIAVYMDTLTDEAYVSPNPDDGRPHVPLGIEITQKSYSWSYSYAEDFILIDFLLRNIGRAEIKKAFIGIYIDADVYHPTISNGFQDDICGFLQTFPSPAGCAEYPLEDTVNVAWIADENGDPTAEGGVLAFNEKSAIAVTGTRVVRTPNPELELSFNWWVSQGDASLDWGPIRVENDRDLGTGGLGTPAGDPNKYFFMVNKEFDYDQLWSAIDFTADGWLPPNTAIGTDLANGYDTRYLLSFGPFDIAIGDSLPITLAYIGGDHFHVNPDDFKKYFNAENPQVFHEKLGFEDLATNAVWAVKVYDNPGVDTDGDGYAGEKAFNPCTGDSIWISGDGEPDFTGPPPPPAPLIRAIAGLGKVTIRWNGYDSETAEDPFSFEQDFEGYRVYAGDALQLSRFALLTTYDLPDYDRYRLNVAFDPPRWELRDTPIHPDSLKAIYEVGDEYNDGIPGWDPDDNPSAQDSLPWWEIVSGSLVEVAYYFRPHKHNRHDLDSTGIFKRFPDADTSELIWVDELNDNVRKAYEYEYTIEGLLPSRPIYMAVTTIDFGHPLTGLGPLESSPLANAVEVWPIAGPKITVFPNPYKINAG